MLAWRALAAASAVLSVVAYMGAVATTIHLGEESEGEHPTRIAQNFQHTRNATGSGPALPLETLKVAEVLGLTLVGDSEAVSTHRHSSGSGVWSSDAARYSISRVARQALETLFSQMDLDGDDRLSYGEFATGLLVTVLESDAAAHKQPEEEERQLLLQAMHSSILATGEGSEKRSAQALPGGCEGDDSLLECLFDSCDRDRDGMLNAAEFERALVEWEEQVQEDSQEDTGAVTTSGSPNIAGLEPALSSFEAGKEDEAESAKQGDDPSFEQRWLKAVQSSEVGSLRDLGHEDGTGMLSCL